MNRPLKGLVCGAAAIATALAGIAPAVAAPGDPTNPTARHTISAAKKAELKRALQRQQATFGGVGSSLKNSKGIVTAFVRLNAPSVVQAEKSGTSTKAAKSKINTMADSVVPAKLTDSSIKSLRAGKTHQVLRRNVTTNVIPGVTVVGDASQIRDLAKKPGVTGVFRVGIKHKSNKDAVSLTKATDAWKTSVENGNPTFGVTGEGVRIGLIDSGFDYTQADFGGPGDLLTYKNAYGKDGTKAIPKGSFDADKFAGGYDFAGPDYEPGWDDPRPDANPIDIPYEHGTHVAGTMAGYGVNADGTTFKGNYSKLTTAQLEDMKIGPGTAPGAQIYALKVFGDGGWNTDLELEALDWAADPDRDGDTSDHLDIVNMSLGTDGGPTDNPENLFIDALTKQVGVLSVIAAGNAGDVTDVAGSPGTAATALTVASSGNSVMDSPGITVNSPADVAGKAKVETYMYNLDPDTYQLNEDPVTGDVVNAPENLSTCADLTAADSAAIDGKIVWLKLNPWWDDCDIWSAANTAIENGAIGALIEDNPDGYMDTILFGGTGALLTDETAAKLRPAMEAGTLKVTIDTTKDDFIREANSEADTISDFSSRGVHGSLGVIKPDVTAPGYPIMSAAAGAGSGSLLMGGTSMATPHVAGIAALTMQSLQTSDPLAVKATVMGTATDDVYSAPNKGGVKVGPLRAGSGRVNALNAVRSTTRVFATANPGLVSLTFGVVPVSQTPVTLTKQVSIKNLSSKEKTYDLSYDSSTTTGGATITISPKTVTVRGGGTKVVDVTFTADPNTLKREIDPSSAKTTELMDGSTINNAFVSSVSGRIVVKNGTEIERIPVQAAPRLQSAMKGSDITWKNNSASLALTGTSKSGDGFESLVAPMQLMATSPKLPAVDAAVGSPSAVKASDIQYVGVSSTTGQYTSATDKFNNGTLAIGISTYGQWASQSEWLAPEVFIDTDNDGSPDYFVTILTYGGADAADVVIANTDEDGYPNDIIDYYPLSGLDYAREGTASDNNVMVLPVGLNMLGIKPGTKPTVSVSMSSGLDILGQPFCDSGDMESGTLAKGVTPADSDDDSPCTELSVMGEIVDSVPSFKVDPYNMPVTFSSAKDGVTEAKHYIPGSIWFNDTTAAKITATKSATATPATKLLLLHSANAVGSRAQVVNVKALPTAPAAPTGKAAQQSIVASFKGVTANPAVDSYQVSATTGSKVKTVTTTKTPVTITGLTPNATYTLKVRAHNAMGWGPWSAASKAVTVPKLPLPSAPGKPAVSGIGKDRATVSWATPTTGKPISSYTVTLTGASKKVVTVTSTKVTVTGLKAGGKYTIKVTAKNSTGSGAASKTTTFTTKKK